MDAARWRDSYAADCAVPAGRPLPDLVAELAEALRHEDPDLRDGEPYVVLRTWIERDLVAGELRRWLGLLMAERFADPAIQARAFAPLVLDMIVARGDVDPAWVDAFARWYPAEEDLRGWDERLGWLHAVAHGADLLGSLGLHRDVDPVAMLDLAAARLTAPTGHLFDQQEDDRLAQALARTLTRPELSEEQAVAWLDAVEADFAKGRPPGVPTTAAHTSNAMRTLRALYVLADTGVTGRRGGPVLAVRHAEAVKARLREVLGLVFQAY
ncbi:DUF2785 domain-containing protein [Streptomyces polyrhachis]|uniref:DUF2785 domain-containing protein n=1 Tax=Streptomyces polyrhachis TaxID=1282885 RepID=A0ABW2GEM0_9ACTN